MTAYLARRVRTTLRKSLADVGVTATVHVCLVQGTQFVRVQIVANKFARLGYSERQDLVWRMLEADLDDDDRKRISIVMTFAPSEFGRRK